MNRVKTRMTMTMNADTAQSMRRTPSGSREEATEDVVDVVERVLSGRSTGGSCFVYVLALGLGWFHVDGAATRHLVSTLIVQKAIRGHCQLITERPT
jgi:hypothetical protein